MNEREAIAHLRRLIDLDGKWFPCLKPCAHDSCALAHDVLSIVEQVENA